MPVSYGYGAATKRPNNEAFAVRSSSAADLKHLNGETKEWKLAKSVDLQRSESTSDCSDSQSVTSSRGNGRLLRDFSVEHIPTRLTNQTGPKLAYNPMQFVKTGPAVQLSQTAREQIEKAKELKKLREVKKEDAEDWQANLEGWKRNRLKRQENVIERVKDVKRNEEEEAWKQAEDALQRNKVKRALRDSHDGNTSSFFSRYSQDGDLSGNAEPEKSSFPSTTTVSHKEPVNDSNAVLRSSSTVDKEPVKHNEEQPPAKPVAAPRRSLTFTEPAVPAPRRRSVKEQIDVNREKEPSGTNEEVIFPLKGAVTQRRSFFEPLPASSDDIQPFDTNRKLGEFRYGFKKAADRSSTVTDKEPAELLTDATRTEAERQVPAAELSYKGSTRKTVVTDTTDMNPVRVPEPSAVSTEVPGSMEQEKTSDRRSISSPGTSRGSLFEKESLTDTTDKKPVRVPEHKAAGTRVPRSMEPEEASGISSPGTSRGSLFEMESLTDTTDKKPVRVPEHKAAGTRVPGPVQRDNTRDQLSSLSSGTSKGSLPCRGTVTDTTDKEPAQAPELPKTQVPKFEERNWEITANSLPSAKSPDRNSVFKDFETDTTDKTDKEHSSGHKVENTGIPQAALLTEETSSLANSKIISITDITDNEPDSVPVTEPGHFSASRNIPIESTEASATPDKSTFGQSYLTDTTDTNLGRVPESKPDQWEKSSFSPEKTFPISGIPESSKDADVEKLENPGTSTSDVSGSEESEWTEDEGIRSLSPEAVIKPDSIRPEGFKLPTKNVPLGKELTNQTEANALAILNPEPNRMEVLATPISSEKATEMAFDWLVGVAPKLAPPSEKPPPPPPPSSSDIEEDPPSAISSPQRELPTTSTKQVTEEIKLRDADTVRNIRSELRKRRSDFLGFEVSAEEVSDVGAVPPPPDLKSIILQTDLRPSDLKMFADQPTNVRDELNRSGTRSSSTGLDFATLARKEEEIIKKLTQDQELDPQWQTDNIYEEPVHPNDNERKEKKSSLTVSIKAKEFEKILPRPSQGLNASANNLAEANKTNKIQMEPNSSRNVPTGEMLKAETGPSKAKQHVTFSEPRKSPNPDEPIMENPVRKAPPTAPKNYVRPEKFFSEPVYQTLEEVAFRSEAPNTEPPLQRVATSQMREKTPYFVKPRPLSVMELHSTAGSNAAVVAKRKPGTDGHRKDIQSHWLIQEAEHRRLFTDNNRSSGIHSHWKSMPSVTGTALAPLPNSRSISAAPQVPLQRNPAEATRSSSSIHQDDPLNQSQSQPIRTTVQVPQSRKETVPALPESIIDTLTRKAAQKNAAREVHQPRPVPQSFRNDHGKGTHPLPPPTQRVNGQSQERFLSISGRKKCSLCGEELGRGAAMIIESLHLFYHIGCFRCTVCGLMLGSGMVGTDVRIRHNKLHCQDCYSTEGLRFSKV